MTQTILEVNVRKISRNDDVTMVEFHDIKSHTEFLNKIASLSKIFNIKDDYFDSEIKFLLTYNEIVDGAKEIVDRAGVNKDIGSVSPRIITFIFRNSNPLFTYIKFNETDKI